MDDYHERQFKIPYRSTILFDNFLSRRISIGGGDKILDLACGGGANEYYFANKYPSAEFIGMDIDTSLFCLFHKYGGSLKNVTLIGGDWFNISEQHIGKYNGVISLQSLSWLPEWEKPLEEICKLQPQFIAMSSLFYEGNIDYCIKLKNFERPENNKKYSECYYNIYPLPKIQFFLDERGYKMEYEPFEIDIDIPKPKSKDIGTYTIKTEDGKRLQISAAMLMPWYFIYAERKYLK